jgi:hypothetical protein
LSAALCGSRCAWGQQQDMPPQPPPGNVIWAARAEPLPSPPSPAADSLELAPLPLDDTWRPGEAFEEDFAELPHGEDCQCLECQGPLLFPRWHGFPRVVPRMLSWWKPQGDGRHRGIGDPLVGTSWLNRPYSFGVFSGGIFGGDFIPGNIQQRGGLLTGIRLGVDLHHYYGFETRLGFSHADSWFRPSGFTSTIDDALLDANLLYYPLGDTRWRPFGSLGLGLHRFQYYDTQFRQTVDTLMQMPIGIGVKYYLHNWMSVRLELQDNLVFGQRDISTLNYVSVTGWVEMRFGGRRTTYFPFDPSIAAH